MGTITRNRNEERRNAEDEAKNAIVDTTSASHIDMSFLVSACVAA